MSLNLYEFFFGGLGFEGFRVLVSLPLVKHYSNV